MTPATATLREDTEALALVLRGDWSQQAEIPDPETMIAALASKASPDTPLRIDGTGVDVWDSTLMSYVVHLHRALPHQSIDWRLPAGAHKLFTLATAIPPQSLSQRQASSRWHRLARQLSPLALSEQVGIHAVAFLAFIGELVSAFGKALLGQARLRVTDVLRFCHQTGPNALPIIGLSSLLVGVILGYLGAVQLQQFGAGIYVANLVTVGVLREMGALMTAVIIAGRTGAAYAAQLGTMQVNEEIDAIEILGVSPMEFLILPRVFAVVIMLPLLTLYADLLGILGGGLVASSLGISPLQYAAQLQESLMLSHIIVGLVKALLFGLLIGLAGCRAGMQSSRNSEGVGQATTRAVVTALIYLIVADAAVNIVCQWLDI